MPRCQGAPIAAKRSTKVVTCRSPVFRAKSLDGDGAKSNAGKQSQRDGVLRFHDVSFCLVEQICTQAGFSVQSE